MQLAALLPVYSGIQDRSEPPDSLLLVGYRPHDADGQELTNGHCYGVGWAPHGNWLAGGYSGHLGGVARVWDITQGTMVAEIPAHEKDVWAVAFDPHDSHLLATCSYDGAAGEDARAGR
eukprot:XP_001697567.1 predicted protein [Chlamydomonas reinhardtii]